jgi:hypothetical protein
MFSSCLKNHDILLPKKHDIIQTMRRHPSRFFSQIQLLDILYVKRRCPSRFSS